MQERMVGYILLIVGILVMAFSVYYVYSILTNKVRPFEVFIDQPKVQQPTSGVQDIVKNPSALVQMQAAVMSEVLGKQMNRSFNIGMTVLLMYILMLFGFRLSSLGVMLIRPIEVKLREKKVEEKIPPQQ